MLMYESTWWTYNCISYLDRIAPIRNRSIDVTACENKFNGNLPSSNNSRQNVIPSLIDFWKLDVKFQMSWPFWELEYEME